MIFDIFDKYCRLYDSEVQETIYQQYHDISDILFFPKIMLTADIKVCSIDVNRTVQQLLLIRRLRMEASP